MEYIQFLIFVQIGTEQPYRLRESPCQPNRILLSRSQSQTVQYEWDIDEIPDEVLRGADFVKAHEYESCRKQTKAQLTVSRSFVVIETDIECRHHQNCDELNHKTDEADELMMAGEESEQLKIWTEVVLKILPSEVIQETLLEVVVTVKSVAEQGARQQCNGSGYKEAKVVGTRAESLEPVVDSRLVSQIWPLDSYVEIKGYAINDGVQLEVNGQTK